MVELRGALRGLVERIPAFAKLYRLLRDELQWRRTEMVETPHGFRFRGDESMQNGTFEPSETHLIVKLLERADLFVDVGAYVGFYTCIARTRGKRVLAIEALPRNVRKLSQNLKANGWNDVELWPLGVASHEGTARLYGAFTGASLVHGWAGASDAFSQTIPVRTLDSILAGRFEGQRLLVKMDVEGSELDVLRGAAQTLRRTPQPWWVIEILKTGHGTGRNPRFLDTFLRMWDAGYQAFTAERDCRKIDRAELEVFAAAGERVPSNWLFLPEGSAVQWIRESP
jgi:FkbM family methyltransferase